jgi:membrane protein involved in colicin uptake
MSSEMLVSEEEIQKAADKAAADEAADKAAADAYAADVSVTTGADAGAKVGVDLPGKALPKPEEIMNEGDGGDGDKKKGGGIGESLNNLPHL